MLKKKYERPINLYAEVKNTILDFDSKFTLRDIILALQEKKIMTEANKNETMEIVNEVLEMSIVQRVSLSDQFYVLGSN